MAAITLGQVLEHVDQFERMQWDFYEKLSKETIHEGVRLLTEYMSRHSVHIRELLETLPPGRKHSFCSPPLPYKPIFPESIASI